MSESLRDGPPTRHRPLPGVPPPSGGPRPVSMPGGKPPAASPRSESMEKWQPMRSSGNESKASRGRPVIQVVDARPMSEVGFRGNDKADNSSSGLCTDGPDITQSTKPSSQGRPDIRRPPPPARPLSFRNSMVTDNNQKNQDSGDTNDIYTSKPLPPQPRRARPRSMLSKLPNPLLGSRRAEPGDMIGDPVTGIDNEGFNSSMQRSRHANDPPCDSHDANNTTCNSKDDLNVPDLLTGDSDGMYKTDMDLLSDVPDEVHPQQAMEMRKPRGVPVIPGGKVQGFPGSRGAPPPLPKKSPSVPNLHKMSAGTTWESLGNTANGNDSDDSDPGHKQPSPTPVVPRVARGPTIIRPGTRITGAASKVDHTNDETDSHESEGLISESSTKTESGEKKLPAGVVGGVRLFPFSLPKSPSDPESVKHSSNSDAHSSGSSTSSASSPRPTPSVKPKPALLAKPALRPKPNIAPKPNKRPQSAIVPSHPNVQKGPIASSHSIKTESVLEEKNMPPKAPWQNELNARLSLRKSTSHAEKKGEERIVVRKDEIVTREEIKNKQKDEWDTDELKDTSVGPARKPGPVKATYRPTIIRAAVPKQSKEEEAPVEPPKASTSPKVMNKRFSSSCVDMQSAGADLDLKMWDDPGRSSEEQNNNQTVSKDDSFKPSSANVVMRKKPTIIRPPSMGNLNRSSEQEGDKPLSQWNTGPMEVGSHQSRASNRQSQWSPPSRPRPPSPVAMRRRSSSYHSDNSRKPPVSPTLRKSSTGKTPPPRPASGPKIDNSRRQSVRIDRLSPPMAVTRRASTGSEDGFHSLNVPHSVALFDYSAQHDDELSFRKGDTVELVRSENPEWMYGRVGRSEGIFPVNFVQVQIPLPSQQTSSTPPQKPQTWPTEPVGPHGIAIHNYNSGEEGDLVFYADDVITLLEWVSEEWRRGECHGKQGLFPVTFINIVVDVPQKKETTGTVVRHEKTAVEVTQKNNSPKVLGYCIASHDFPGQHDGDLPFSQGDRITLLEKLDADWLRGELNGREGIFPTGFVHIDTETTSIESPPPPLPSSPPPDSATPGITLAVVLYQFPGEAEGDLPLTVGDEVEVLQKIDEEWMRGRVEGREGIFPAAFVEIFS